MYIEDTLLDPLVLIVEIKRQNVQGWILLCPQQYAFHEVRLVLVSLGDFLG